MLKRTKNYTKIPNLEVDRLPTFQNIKIDQNTCHNLSNYRLNPQCKIIYLINEEGFKNNNEV